VVRGAGVAMGLATPAQYRCNLPAGASGDAKLCVCCRRRARARQVQLERQARADMPSCVCSWRLARVREALYRGETGAIELRVLLQEASTSERATEASTATQRGKEAHASARRAMCVESRQCQCVSVSRREGAKEGIARPLSGLRTYMSGTRRRAERSERAAGAVGRAGSGSTAGCRL
jgi:hypothetical protein